MTIDLMRHRLVRAAQAEPSEEGEEAAWALVEMYDAGVVEGRMEAGEILLSLREGHEEALARMHDPPLHPLVDPPLGAPYSGPSNEPL